MRFQKPISPRDFFFIEDTSVIIKGLSTRREFPGVDVKYWMQKTSFKELDAQLRRHDNNRDVTVRSDVLLHLPEDFRAKTGIRDKFIQFTAKTDGAITEKQIVKKTNLLYPWLDSRSFNKWFVPKGSDAPISALPIEIADKYDIRKKSIGAMLEFLSNHNVFEDHPESVQWPVIKDLPGILPPLLIVTGLPCAGKTTLGAYLSEHYGFYHIEASDFMKRAFYERHGINSDLSVEKFAEKALVETPDIVVKPVLEEIERSKEGQVVVTGFRSPKEIEIFTNLYRGPSNLAFWYIEAEEGIRYQRNVKRARHDAAETLKSFKKRDLIQLRMGLRAIRQQLRHSTVVNENTIADYLKLSSQKLGLTKIPFRWPRISDSESRPISLEESILIGLAASRRTLSAPLTTTQIAHKINDVFHGSPIETNKNNVSRYFNFKPHPYYKIEKIKNVIRYSLTATGFSRAMRLLSRKYNRN